MATKDKKVAGAEKPAKEKKVGGKSAVNSPKTMEVTVTEEFLAENPEIAAQGHKVGDIIQVEDDAAEMEKGETPTLKAPKGNEDVAIVKGEEFIRVYPASTSAEDVNGFVEKVTGRKAVGADSISKLVVEWTGEKTDPKSPGNKITYRASQKFTRDEHGEGMFTAALKLKAEKHGATVLYY